MSEHEESTALAAQLLALGRDHRAIYTELVRTLVDKAAVGTRKYGRLELATDTRDFRDELIGELVDAVHYAHGEIVRLRRALLPVPVYSCSFPIDDVSRGLRELAYAGTRRDTEKGTR